MSVFDPTEWNLGNVSEPQALPEGEYKCRIISVRKGVDKNSLEYWQPLLEVCDEPDSKDFTHFLHIPNKSEMSPKQYKRVCYALQEFMLAFELDFSVAFDPTQDWGGNEGWAILGVRRTDEYGDQNQIVKVISGSK